MSNHPLVTIVTPSYNSGAFIEETIQSVLGQTYPNIEYIVMDGGSTDNTLDILQKYADQLTFFSEPDEGQSDAINKGWQRGQGEIIAWLCADDLYLPDSIETAVDTLLAHPKNMWLYGRSRGIDREGNAYPFRAPVLAWNYDDLLQEANYIAQPTVFLRRAVLQEKGYLLTSLNYVMDYEYWLRIGRDFPPVFIDHVLAEIRYYPETKSAAGGLQRLQELQTIMACYGAHELVRGYRFDWVRSHLDEMIKDVVRREWSGLVEHVNYDSILVLYQRPSHVS